MKKEIADESQKSASTELTHKDDLYIAIGIGIVFGIPMVIQLFRFYVLG